MPPREVDTVSSVCILLAATERRIYYPRCIGMQKYKKIVIWHSQMQGETNTRIWRAARSGWRAAAAVNSFDESNKRRKQGLLYKSCHYNMDGATATCSLLFSELTRVRSSSRNGATKSQLFPDLNDSIGSQIIVFAKHLSLIAQSVPSSSKDHTPIKMQFYSIKFESLAM